MAIKWACALDQAIRDERKKLGDDVLSAMECEDLHAKSVGMRAQKTGYLNKAGKNVLQQWPKRYLILRDDLLYYYKTSTDDKPLGVINLLLCTIKPNIPDKKFDVILPTRTYFFSADTCEEVVQWSEALTSAHDRIYDDLASNTAKLQVGGKCGGGRGGETKSARRGGRTSKDVVLTVWPQNFSMSSSISKYEKGLSTPMLDEKKGLDQDKVEDNSAKDRLLEFAKEARLSLSHAHYLPSLFRLLSPSMCSRPTQCARIVGLPTHGGPPSI